jgi:glucosamine-6-phosphate deaminase
MDNFSYNLPKWLPFQDSDMCKKVREIKRSEICNHNNPEFKIEVIKDSEIELRNLLDIFYRIKTASDKNEKLVLILPQPHPLYAKLTYFINKFKVSCKNLYTFNMDEYADEDGNIAPENFKGSFMYAMKNNFYKRIDEELRPPEDHICGPTNKNLKDYGKMIEDLGGADVCYGGVGWSGHIAFVEPGAKEFEGSFEDWKEMGTRIVTLTPFTIAQNSLGLDYGASGDWSSIPPKAATIGPKEIISAKLRSSWNSFLVGGNISWQRFIVRFASHGPVTNLVPATILQTLRTDFYISESNAQDIKWIPYVQKFQL